MNKWHQYGNHILWACFTFSLFSFFIERQLDKPLIFLCNLLFLFFTWQSIWALKEGRIRVKSSWTKRGEEPFLYYIMLFFYVLLSIMMGVVNVLLYMLHRQNG